MPAAMWIPKYDTLYPLTAPADVTEITVISPRIGLCDPADPPATEFEIMALRPDIQFTIMSVDEAQLTWWCSREDLRGNLWGTTLEALVVAPLRYYARHERDKPGCDPVVLAALRLLTPEQQKFPWPLTNVQGQGGA